jgi:hypothetical protein
MIEKCRAMDKYHTHIICNSVMIPRRLDPLKMRTRTARTHSYRDKRLKGYSDLRGPSCRETTLSREEILNEHSLKANKRKF